MQEFIIGIMSQYGYLGIFLLIAIENIFPPIPSEVILTFGGFITISAQMNPWLVIVYATLGSVVGAIVLYALGRLLSKERLEKIVTGKIGKILFLKKEDIDKADTWFSKKGKYTVFFCRFIPIVRSLISIPAGMNKMSMPLFLTLTTVGTAIWNIVLVWLGVFAGDSWEKIAGYFDIYSKIALVVLGIIGLILVYIFYKKVIKPRIAERKENN